MQQLWDAGGLNRAYPVCQEGLALPVAAPVRCNARGCAIAPLLARHAAADVAPVVRRD